MLGVHSGGGGDDRRSYGYGISWAAWKADWIRFLVLSGVTSREEVDLFPYRPRLILNRCRRHSGLMRERASARRSQDRNKTEKGKSKRLIKLVKGKVLAAEHLVFVHFLEEISEIFFRKILGKV